MFRKVLFLWLLFITVVFSSAKGTVMKESSFREIRGVVTDYASGMGIPYATLQLTTDLSVGVVTDSAGMFILRNVPIGRHSLQVSCLGYEPLLVKELLLSSSKDKYLEIALKENVAQLNEVLVRPRVSKELPLNKMAITGSRMLSVEEASRYAGGFDDPARLASAFSGTASEGATNGISIHGNAPHLLLWRMEGIEIPNPNHFADISILGGGIFSSLSAQVLGNSDFFTGAFPAEYNNAVSGIFDMKLRNGNDRHFEHTMQVGVGGIDIASEGPINKVSGSSYIVNYRYSMTGLVDQLGLMDMHGEQMDYQDLNFKLSFPTAKRGVFTVWGTSLIDNFKASCSDSTEWKYSSDKTVSRSRQYMAAGGVANNYFLPDGSLIRSAIASTFFKEHASTDSYNKEMTLFPFMDMHRGETHLVGDVSYTRKFNVRFTSKAGVSYTRMFYDMQMKLAPSLEEALTSVYNGEGNTGLGAAYLSNSWHPVDMLTFNFGVNTQFLSLNNTWTVEPRVGIKLQLSPQVFVAGAYGMHSRSEKTDVYFVQLDNNYVNKNLGFTKAHHLIFTYGWKISENINLKVEPYYQMLYNVPVEANSSYSVLNRNDFYLDKALVNTGKGKNYGIDFTLERYMEQGWYAMFTGSLFNSSYCGGDGVWRNTRYNRHFIVNMLGGKEWMVGARKQNMLSANIRFTLQGGEYYSPVDFDATLAHPDNDVQYDETHAFSAHYDPSFVIHYTISYKMNMRKFAHEFSIKHINATRSKSYYGHSYNYKTGIIEPNGFALSLPNVSYKLEF